MKSYTSETARVHIKSSKIAIKFLSGTAARISIHGLLHTFISIICAILGHISTSASEYLCRRPREPLPTSEFASLSDVRREPYLRRPREPLRRLREPLRRPREPLRRPREPLRRPREPLRRPRPFDGVQSMSSSVNVMIV